VNRFNPTRNETNLLYTLKNFFITGPPRAGKTTLLKRIMQTLREHNIKLAGILCPEVRVNNRRWGFKIIDLKTSREGILASIEIPKGPKISKYRVNVVDLEEVGVKALQNALRDESEVVIVDEIGKMELVSENFSHTVKQLLDSDKILLGIIPARYTHPLLSEIRRRRDTKIYWIGRETPASIRQKIHDEIVEIILKRLKKNA